MHRNFNAEITSNVSLNEYFKVLSISPFSKVKLPEPGQFYMLQTGDTNDPLLKRPFSIFNWDENTLQFLYRIRGKGTRNLSNLKAGCTLNVIGPLGNSYLGPEGDFIAVAGGVGIASLYSLLKRFPKRGHLFYGARCKDELVMLDEVRAVAKDVFVSTDDGSCGEKCLITGPLGNFISSSNISTIYACGPTPMLKEVSSISAGTAARCYVSLEGHMACGVGACLGCVIKVREGSHEPVYKRVCKEGTIFDAGGLAW